MKANVFNDLIQSIKTKYCPSYTVQNLNYQIFLLIQRNFPSICHILQSMQRNFLYLQYSYRSYGRKRRSALRGDLPTGPLNSQQKDQWFTDVSTQDEVQFTKYSLDGSAQRELSTLSRRTSGSLTSAPRMRYSSQNTHQMALHRETSQLRAE